MSEQVFALPDVGEGLTEAEIVRWRVQPGDEVAVNDPIVDIETAKAVVELPCPYAGVIGELLVAEGQVVAVGTPILSVTGKSLLIGYGVMSDTASLPSSTEAPARTQAPESTQAPVNVRALAKPPVRALARELGIDLASVTATGPRGDVTRADLYATREPTAASAGERVAVRGIQRTMAQAMVRSVHEVPQVSVWRDVDVTGATKLLAQLRTDPGWAGVRVTPVTLICAAMVHAVRTTPIINSRWHDLADGTAEIETHRQVDLSVAVAGPRGLVVPHIPDADRMNLHQLATAISTLTERARADLLTPAELVGGTITVTNIGVFGADGGTPMINPGQSAILATGRIMERPWAINGGLTVRPIMTLSLTFDHRVVDGAAGATFLAAVSDYLSTPPSSP